MQAKQAKLAIGPEAKLLDLGSLKNCQSSILTCLRDVCFFLGGGRNKPFGTPFGIMILMMEFCE